jgi:signal transduction protein with GAF and PtsI domain
MSRRKPGARLARDPLGLDRPGLLRAQVRAMLRAGVKSRSAHHVPDDGDGR